MYSSDAVVHQPVYQLIVSILIEYKQLQAHLIALYQELAQIYFLNGNNHVSTMTGYSYESKILAKSCAKIIPNTEELITEMGFDAGLTQVEASEGAVDNDENTRDLRLRALRSTTPNGDCNEPQTSLAVDEMITHNSYKDTLTVAFDREKLQKSSRYSKREEKSSEPIDESTMNDIPDEYSRIDTDLENDLDEEASVAKIKHDLHIKYRIQNSSIKSEGGDNVSIPRRSLSGQLYESNVSHIEFLQLRSSHVVI
jgi:hypothetical protein